MRFKLALNGLMWNRRDTMRREVPKSVCKCGHSGDGPNSQHKNDYGPDISPGHGECKARGCSCIKFTWVEFISLNQLTPHPTKRIWQTKGGK